MLLPIYSSSLAAKFKYLHFAYANVGKLGLFVNTQMSDDLVKQLSSYKAQLQQVEVALSTDPDNEDLLKLQKDLQVCVNNLDYYTNSSNLCSIALFIYSH